MIAVLLFVIINSIRSERSYIEMHAALKNRIESYFEDLPFAPHMRQAHYMYLRATNRHHFNEVTTLTDGRLLMDNLEPHFFLYERANGIIALGDYLYRNDMPFLYVQVPSKLEDNSVLPLAFSDNQSIEYSNRLRELIADAGIDTFDMREAMIQQGMDFTTAFFRMDHHWTAETAIWASRTIGEQVNELYDLGIDTGVWDFSNFESVTFENAFQGSEITSLHGYHIFEDITAFFPNFQTDIELRSWGYDPIATGDFIDVFIPRLRNEGAENIVYFDYGDMTLPIYPFMRITNNLVNNDRSILLIVESNGLLLAPFMALDFETVYVVYLIYEVTPNNLWYALDMFDYDAVVMAVSDVVVAHRSLDYFFRDRLFLGYPPN